MRGPAAPQDDTHVQLTRSTFPRARRSNPSCASHVHQPPWRGLMHCLVWFEAVTRGRGPTATSSAAAAQLHWPTRAPSRNTFWPVFPVGGRQHLYNLRLVPGLRLHPPGRLVVRAVQERHGPKQQQRDGVRHLPRWNVRPGGQGGKRGWAVSATVSRSPLQAGQNCGCGVATACGTFAKGLTCLEGLCCPFGCMLQRGAARGAGRTLL